MPEPASKEPATDAQAREDPASSTSASATTPGPRAQRLQQVFDQALARTLRANSYANFSGCFPTPGRHVPASLESVWRQLNAKLEESARAEFEDIVREREAVELLNELDRLVGEARGRREDKGDADGEEIAYVLLYWPGCVLLLMNCLPRPHTLPPDELFKAHLTPHLREMQSVLGSRVEDAHAQNADLAQTVHGQRAEIQSLLQGLEAVVADLDGAAEAASQFTRENDLRQENVQMDEEVRARPA